MLIKVYAVLYEDAGMVNSFGICTEGSLTEFSFSRYIKLSLFVYNDNDKVKL
jgi:hypothetical protein